MRCATACRRTKRSRGSRRSRRARRQRRDPRAYRARLVGVSIEHRPRLQIVVLLAGDEPVAETSIVAAGLAIPVLFRVGAKATGDDVIRAMLQHGPELSAVVAQGAAAWGSIRAPANW